LEKYGEGFLLVLCSKNNEDDVWEVFDHHPQMKLKREHIAAHRINWSPKSGNLVSVSKELNLGLDSFIFLDDSNFETEQVSVSCPEVFSLTLPEDADTFFSFLNHIWEFDIFQVTGEDRQRNQMYKAEKERKEEQANYAYLNDFIQSLNIEINLHSLEEKDRDRALQLTLRTNQFNLNGIRKTREDIQHAMQQEGTLNWIIDVKDRFGDYGIVGLLLARETQTTLIIDTFLLSCRVLGRNIEDFILAELEKYCVIKKLDIILAYFRSTPKNQPFLDFLTRTGWVADHQTNTYSFLIKNSNQTIVAKNEK
jgi:FkbH-like protein